MPDDTAKNNKVNKTAIAQPQSLPSYRAPNHGVNSASFDQDLSKWEADSMHNVKDEIMRQAFPTSF